MSLYVGVMSGTSLDGLDVAIVEFEGDRERPAATRVVSYRSAAYDAEFRERLRATIDEGRTPDVCELDFELGRRIGAGVEETLSAAGVPASDVVAVGSHGQTLWHVPPAGGLPGATLQVGNPSVIAEMVGADVVSDFRHRDMAAGGHGAPLTAYTDRLLFTAAEPRTIQNIGGIANLATLPPAGSSDSPVAFDTGPGVVLIDGAVRRLVDRPFDRDGELAAAGTVDETALAEWLADPFFDEPVPRSTGRERFSTARLGAWLEARPALRPEDAVATLTELTARTVADGHRLVGAAGDCYVCGGGARNPVLVARLGELLAPRRVADLSELGVDPEAREAVAFALLARQHVRAIPVDMSWATGGAGPRVLGSRTPA